MSNVHIASAANEVAQALPSTATVTVSKHGIQSIETLNLEAQTANDSQITWSRTFSGMEILTNPTINLRTKSTFTCDKSFGFSLKNFQRLQEAFRPSSDPVANAANSLNVTVNNASMSITPARDHRIVTTVYPDEVDMKHQRKHYGLNQLDQFAESAYREFQVMSHDDVEKQHNSNALRENYPARWFLEVGGTDVQVGPEDFNVPVVQVTNIGSAAASFEISAALYGREIGKVKTASLAVNASVTCVITKDGDKSSAAATIIDPDELPKLSVDQLQHLSFSYTSTSTTRCRLGTPFMAANSDLGLRYDNDASATDTSINDLPDNTNWTVVYDLYQPLNHPYFRDNAMRDNTLVNVRYFDCQLTLDSTKRMIEVARLMNGYKTEGSGSFTNLDDVSVTTNIFLPNQEVAGSKGIQPTLIFDLVTPSVPLPTISDKVIKTYHTITSTQVSLGAATTYDKLNSGNIQLAQVPDMIYVFIRSDKDLNAYTNDALHVPTRLGVVTELRLRTPQNSAFLINMDQESLYQMSCRNGSKQSRSAFMASLGSVIAIDPEKDLGGYTNGVLIPFTFDVSANFSLPMRSGTATDSRLHGKDLKGGVVPLGGFDSTTGENWTMFVVCELQGHLYLMSDGTGKQTKSNLTVTEVADAVADGIHHPSTFPTGRVSKMDAGVLGEVARSSAGEVGDDVRAALRA